MKKLLAAALSTAILALTVAATPALAGQTSNYIGTPKTPLRYVVQAYTFSTTAAVSGAVVGVVPPGGAVLKDVVLLQAAQGTGGTSWTATPKKNGTALVSTPGGFTLAAGANKATNAAASPLTVFTNPSGGTRPVLDAAQVSANGGEAITIDIALTGVYSGAVTGQVLLYWDPKK